MSHVLFKDTVNVTDVRGPRGNEILSSIDGQEALRVLHRDKPIKVVITEEFYLSLLTFWQSTSDSGLASRSRKKMKAAAIDQLNSDESKPSRKKSAS